MSRHVSPEKAGSGHWEANNGQKKFRKFFTKIQLHLPLLHLISNFIQVKSNKPWEKIYILVQTAAL